MDNFLVELPFKEVLKRDESITVRYAMNMSFLIRQRLINNTDVVYLCVCPYCHNILKKQEDLFQEDMEEFDYTLEIECLKCGRTFTQEEMNVIKLGKVIRNV